ncbi:unnamed protein product [Durusdinium trenchii]
MSHAANRNKRTLASSAARISPKQRDKQLKRLAAHTGDSRRERQRFSDGFIPRDENTIYMSPLPSSLLSKYEIKEALELAFGKVTHVHLDRGLKFGFARFEDERCAETAMEMRSIEFLNETVEMRSGSKGRKHSFDDRPDPHQDLLSEVVDGFLNSFDSAGAEDGLPTPERKAKGRSKGSQQHLKAARKGLKAEKGNSKQRGKGQGVRGAADRSCKKRGRDVGQTEKGRESNGGAEGTGRKWRKVGGKGCPRKEKWKRGKAGKGGKEGNRGNSGREHLNGQLQERAEGGNKESGRREGQAWQPSQSSGDYPERLSRPQFWQAIQPQAGQPGGRTVPRPSVAPHLVTPCRPSPRPTAVQSG